MINKYNELLRCRFSVPALLTPFTKDSLSYVYDINKLTFDEYKISKKDIIEYLESEYSFHEMFFDNIRHLSKKEFFDNNIYKRQLMEIINIKNELVEANNNIEQDVDILT